jgi:hypothetical protein
MSISTDAYEIVGVPHAWIETLALTRRQRIDVMHNNAVVNLIALKTEIASKISRDNLGASLSPNIALVETLIHPPGSTKGLSEKCSIE